MGPTTGIWPIFSSTPSVITTPMSEIDLLRGKGRRGEGEGWKGKLIYSVLAEVNTLVSTDSINNLPMELGQTSLKFLRGIGDLEYFIFGAFQFYRVLIFPTF